MEVLLKLSTYLYNKQLNILTGQIGLHVVVHAIEMEVNYDLDTASLKKQLKTFRPALVKFFNIDHVRIQSA